MLKKYTGWDGDSSGKRAGAELWFALCCEYSDGALWNNGTWVVRNKRGGKSPSVHGTGRAGDLSYRRMAGKGVPNGREQAVVVMNFLVENAGLLGVEAVLDYFPKPYGRGYRCDRDGWLRYKKPTLGGAPGGDWIHVEVSNDMADSVKKVNDAWFKASNGKVGKASADSVDPQPQQTKPQNVQKKPVAKKPKTA